MNNRVATLVVLAGAVGTAQAATITEDFEGVTAPSLPAGWQTVGAGLTTDTNGNPTNSLNVAGGGTNYLVNSGAAFDATQAISGTFDFYVVENGNYSNINFFIGDVQDGLTGASAGEFLKMDLRERTFGARANIFDGAGTKVFTGDGNNQYRIDTNLWINASFTWTPTSGTTGDFSFEWTYPAQPNRGPMTVNGYTFDSNEIFFGFGTQDDPARFDNISITGNEVPEPGSLALLGLGGLLIASHRRRG